MRALLAALLLLGSLSAALPQAGYPVGPLPPSLPLSAANGGAGTINGALKGNGSGTVSQAACTDLSNGGTACSQAYTESTWTPAITTDGTVGTPAYTVQVGSYERIGRLVIARWTIQLSGWTGSPTGNVSIAGLPFTSSATTNDQSSCIVAFYLITGLAASNWGMTGRVLPNTTTAGFLSASNGGTNAVTAAQIGTTPVLQGTCWYRT